MPGGFPLGFDICNGVSAGVGTGSMGIALGTGTITANTKTGFQTIISSTTYDAVAAFIAIEASCSSITTFLADLAIGAAASEQVVVSNLEAQVGVTSPNIAYYFVPLCIPAGTRVSGRFQSANGGTFGSGISCNMNLILFDGAYTQMEGYAGVDSVNASTSTSQGTAVTPSATANTYGSYTQLIASTARDYVGLMYSGDVHTTTFGSNLLYTFEIAIGGSGSEQIIIGSSWFYATSGGNACQDVIGWFIPVTIPSGTRIAAHCKCNGASKPAMGISVYGVYQ